MFHQASLKLGLDRAVLAHARNEQVICAIIDVVSSTRKGVRKGNGQRIGGLE